MTTFRSTPFKASLMRCACLCASLVFVACSQQGTQGDPGPQGPVGATGPAGTMGPQGTAGPAGRHALVVSSVEASGENCTTGGVKLSFGADANRDDVLQDEELDPALTRFVCNGDQGPDGATGATGATGPMGPPGSQGLYGDGSAGALSVAVGQTLDLGNAAQLNGLPGGLNMQFSSITINGTLIAPSGTVLRASGAITVGGTIEVQPGAGDAGNGEAHPGVSQAAASGALHGGRGLGALQSSRVRVGLHGGGSGGRMGAASGGEGGGSLLLAARGSLRVLAGGSINAAGANASSPNDVVGAGGGGGGVVLLLGRGGITIDGTVRARGGNGASPVTTTGSGEGGGGGGGGGIIHLLSATAPVTTAATLDVGGGSGGVNAVAGTYTVAGAGGGASGGNGGSGGGMPAFGQPLQASSAGLPGHILVSLAPEPELLLVP